MSGRLTSRRAMATPGPTRSPDRCRAIKSSSTRCPGSTKPNDTWNMDVITLQEWWRHRDGVPRRPERARPRMGNHDTVLSRRLASMTMPYYVAGRPTTTGEVREVVSPLRCRAGRCPCGARCGRDRAGGRSRRGVAANDADAERLHPGSRARPRLAAIGRTCGRSRRPHPGRNGKPAMWAKAEVARAVSTFRWAAEEARRFSGELQRLDTDPSATGRMALVRRFAGGAVLVSRPSTSR